MSGHEREELRKHQIARNEALFREVNERVQEVSEDRATLTTDFVCECGDTKCTDTIPLRDEEYEHVRADPLLFALVPGHEIPDVEEVVAEHERFNIVRKHVAEGILATQTNPRD
jgi:transcription initiation factor TFIID subunit TAF12